MTTTTKPNGQADEKITALYFPTEQEILAMMQEIRENPQDFRFVA